MSKLYFPVRSFRLVAMALLCSVGTVDILAQNLTYMGSVQYATGSYYFTERTGSFYVNNGFGVSGEGYSLSLNIPFIVQNNPWVSYTSTQTGRLPTGGPSNGMIDSIHAGKGRMGNGKIDPGTTGSSSLLETHFGDPSLSGYTKIYRSATGKTSLNGNVAVKMPLADPSSGFGTGAWDIGAGLSWGQRIARRVLLIAGGSYWWLGDMEELTLNNIVEYNVALGYSFGNNRWLSTASLFGSTAVIHEVDPPLNTSFAISYQVSSKLNINGNLLLGLTESASDFGLGLGWSIKL